MKTFVITISEDYSSSAVFTGCEQDACDPEYRSLDCWEEKEHPLFLGFITAPTAEMSIESASREFNYPKFILEAAEIPGKEDPDTV